MLLGAFDPTGLLVGFGVFAVVSGTIYRLPMPVQPMKVVAALAIAGGLSAPVMMASGILLGLALLLLGSSGAIEHMRRLVPRTVLLGIQLGLGLQLVAASADLTGEAFGFGLLAFSLLLLLHLTPLRPLACLLLLAGGIAWAWPNGEAAWPSIALAVHLPSFSWPTPAAFGEAMTGAFWPQLAMTVTNAVLLTSVLAGEYFPSAKAQTQPTKLACSSGALNLLLAPFGAMPMCHGAGGLVAQYHQGARRGLAPIVFGVACLALGVFAGPAALDWLMLVPLPIIGALLAYAGLMMIQIERLAHVSRICLAVITLTALTSLMVNVAAGLAAGLIAELIRSFALKGRRPSV